VTVPAVVHVIVNEHIPCLGFTLVKVDVVALGRTELVPI
jgi:hypothetical protein